jgi:DNA polymerase-3 subunit gamma/tau
MAPETIREHLQKVLQTENVNADVQSLKLLARAARGSMRDALSLTDQAIAFGSGSLQEATVRQMLGSVDRSYVFRLIDALALGDGRCVVETSETLRLNGLSAGATLEEMSAVLQRMAVIQAVPAMGSESDAADPEITELVRLAQAMPADETQLLYSICLHGRGELGLAPDEYAALTMVLLRLLAFKPKTPYATASAEKKTLIEPARGLVAPLSPIPDKVPVPAPVIAPASQTRVQAWDDEPNKPLAHVKPENNAIENIVKTRSLPVPPQGQHIPVVGLPVPPGQSLKNEVNQAPAHTYQAPDATNIVAIPVRLQADSRADVVAAQSANVLNPTPEGDFWHATVQSLIASDAITAMVRELALQSQLVARDTDQWLLRVERESLNQPGSRDRLTAALQTAGFSVRLEAEVGRVTDSPAKRNAAAAAAQQLVAEKIVFDDPFVQNMMRDFGAKIVPGSIKSC